MSGRDIVVVGASAGGIAVLSDLLPRLPADLAAAVFITLHRAPVQGSETDYLPEIFNRESSLRVVPAVAGGRYVAGQVYVTPRGYQLSLAQGLMHLQEKSEVREHGGSIDALFRSAAEEHRERVVAVLLTGRLRDGTAGLWHVRRNGGIVILQDPALAEHESMPRTALDEVSVHYCLSVPEIASTLAQVTARSARARSAPAVRRPRVLIVEDERIVSANLEQRLADLGYEVVGATASGECALELAGELRPDVVLLDVQLSGELKGTEVGRLLWERFQTPIVYLTAYSDENTLNEAERSRPYAFLVKPVRAPQVHAALRLALERHRSELRNRSLRARR